MFTKQHDNFLKNMDFLTVAFFVNIVCFTLMTVANFVLMIKLLSAHAKVVEVWMQMNETMKKKAPNTKKAKQLQKFAPMEIPLMPQGITDA